MSGRSGRVSFAGPWPAQPQQFLAAAAAHQTWPLPAAYGQGAAQQQQQQTRKLGQRHGPQQGRAEGGVRPAPFHIPKRNKLTRKGGPLKPRFYSKKKRVGPHPRAGRPPPLHRRRNVPARPETPSTLPVPPTPWSPFPAALSPRFSPNHLNTPRSATSSPSAHGSLQELLPEEGEWLSGAQQVACFSQLLDRLSALEEHNQALQERVSSLERQAVPTSTINPGSSNTSTAAYR